MARKARRKCSDLITDNNRGYVSQNREYSRRFANEDAEFRCRSCNFEPEFCSAENRRCFSFDAISESKQILFRRPRLVLGLYLGKEPLEYQKTSTPFRFSFQTTNKETADKENDGEKVVKRKIVYPKSMTVGLCSLQTRPVKYRQFKHDGVGRKSVVSTSGISTSQVNTTLAMDTKSPSKLSDQHPGKEVPLLAGKEAKPKLDLKKAGKVKVKGNMPRQFQEKPPVESEKTGMLRSDFLHRKNEQDSLRQFRTVTSQLKDVTDNKGKIPAEFYVEYCTFKLSDYDIWSRTSKTC